MNASECNRNILIYRIYAMFNEPLFWGPIVIMSLQKLAFMPLADIYLMESAVLCLAALLDVPTGTLADLIGRKKTVVIGRVFLFVYVFFFAFMSSPLEAWIGNILWAIGLSLQSGADTALLYDTLKECGREGEYKRIEGKAIGSRLLLVAFCSIATGFLADVDLRLPLYASLPFVAVPLIAALFWKEPIRTRHYSMRGQFETLKRGGLFVIRSTEVRWMVGFAALLATTSKLWFFTYNPYFELVGIDLPYFGFIFFLLNVVAWFSSHHAYRLETFLGERGSILGMVLCLGVPIFLMGLVPIWPFASLVLVQNVVRGFMRPFVGDYINKHVETDVRATVLSVHSSVSNLVAILGLAGFGFLVARFDLASSLLVLGSVSLGAGMLSYGYYVKKVVRDD
jgi:MFS family permease